MQPYLISLLIFTPLLAAFAALLLPAETKNSFRILTLAVNIFQLLILVIMLRSWDAAAGLQFVEQQNWITLNLGSWGTLQAQYLVGADGLGLPLSSALGNRYAHRHHLIVDGLQERKGILHVAACTERRRNRQLHGAGLPAVLPLLRVHAAAHVLPYRHMGRAEARICIHQILFVYAVGFYTDPYRNDRSLYLGS